jgi:hypothetical protein
MVRKNPSENVTQQGRRSGEEEKDEGNEIYLPKCLRPI